MCPRRGIPVLGGSKSRPERAGLFVGIQSEFLRALIPLRSSVLSEPTSPPQSNFFLRLIT